MRELKTGPHAKARKKGGDGGAGALVATPAPVQSNPSPAQDVALAFATQVRAGTAFPPQPADAGTPNPLAARASWGNICPAWGATQQASQTVAVNERKGG